MDNTAAYKALVSRMKGQVEVATHPRYKLPITDHETLTKMLTATYCAEVAKRQMTFVDDEALKDRISRVANWMTGISKPSLIIYGNQVGTGKSTMANAIFQVLNFFHEDKMFLESGVTQTKRVSAMDLIRIHRDKPQGFEQLLVTHRLIIDDVGTEPANVKVYGTESSPLTELLFARYDRRLWTVITSNLSDDDLRNRYGVRVTDRFNELFDKIYFSGYSYRK